MRLKLGWRYLAWFWLISFLVSGALPAQAADNFPVFLPLVVKNYTPPPAFPADKNNTLAYVNYFRAWAGVPPVTFDATLNFNCLEHARYMAETGDLTHARSRSAAGLICANKGNAWLGGAFFQPYWQPYHSVESWMSSVGHRLWLLYPTTPTFGYGFFTAGNNQAGAALDVISTFTEGAAYPGWPIRYPGPNQTGVPASAYPITLHWRYFGPTPSIGATSLTTSGGAPIPHSANTAVGAGHQGIQVIPNGSLPANTTIQVSIAGNYNGAPFTYAWSFTTGP